jgi:hypothetical protein
MKKRLTILFCMASLWGAHAHAQAARHANRAVQTSGGPILL